MQNSNAIPSRRQNLITPAILAERIGLHPTTIRRYARTGLIPSERLAGGRIGLEPTVIDQLRRGVSA